MEEKKINEEKVYPDERFEFAIYVNNFIICKRFVRIYNFIEHSMETLDFKYCVDEIVEMIKNDLNSKSRVWTWYNFNPENPDANPQATEELTSPLIEPWECTFKFEITDNGKLVMSKIWDGYCYPRVVRDNVDLANKSVKIMTNGTPVVYDKEFFFEKNKDTLFGDLLVLRGMIMDRPDVLFAITKKICETCSSRDNSVRRLSANTIVTYGNDDKSKGKKEYNFNIEDQNTRMFRSWTKQKNKNK